jgi:hypothetical protein
VRFARLVVGAVVTAPRGFLASHANRNPSLPVRGSQSGVGACHGTECTTNVHLIGVHASYVQPQHGSPDYCAARCPCAARVLDDVCMVDWSQSECPPDHGFAAMALVWCSPTFNRHDGMCDDVPSCARCPEAVEIPSTQPSYECIRPPPHAPAPRVRGRAGRHEWVGTSIATSCCEPVGGARCRDPRQKTRDGHVSV